MNKKYKSLVVVMMVVLAIGVATLSSIEKESAQQPEMELVSNQYAAFDGETPINCPPGSTNCEALCEDGLEGC